MIRLRAAKRPDLPAIERLLTANDLPTAGVRDHLAGFLVAEAEGQIVGAAGVEVYGQAALLRSVVVDGGYRGRGLAGRFVRALLDSASERGLDRVFLLTTGAAGYFRRHGFDAIPRAELPASLSASKELQDGLCDTAQAMTFRLPHPSQGGHR